MYFFFVCLVQVDPKILWVGLYYYYRQILVLGWQTMNKRVFYSALKVLMNSEDCYPSYASYCATLSFSIALYSCSID